jgi:hypothetical protein
LWRASHYWITNTRIRLESYWIKWIWKF